MVGAGVGVATDGDAGAETGTVSFLVATVSGATYATDGEF